MYIVGGTYCTPAVHLDTINIGIYVHRRRNILYPCSTYRYNKNRYMYIVGRTYCTPAVHIDTINIGIGSSQVEHTVPLQYIHIDTINIGICTSQAEHTVPLQYIYIVHRRKSIENLSFQNRYTILFSSLLLKFKRY